MARGQPPRRLGNRANGCVARFTHWVSEHDALPLNIHAAQRGGKSGQLPFLGLKQLAGVGWLLDRHPWNKAKSATRLAGDLVTPLAIPALSCVLFELFGSGFRNRYKDGFPGLQFHHASLDVLTQDNADVDQAARRNYAGNDGIAV